MRRVCGAKVTRLTLGDLSVCREASGVERRREGTVNLSRNGRGRLRDVGAPHSWSHTISWSKLAPGAQVDSTFGYRSRRLASDRLLLGHGRTARDGSQGQGLAHRLRRQPRQSDPRRRLGCRVCQRHRTAPDRSTRYRATLYPNAKRRSAAVNNDFQSGRRKMLFCRKRIAGSA